MSLFSSNKRCFLIKDEMKWFRLHDSFHSSFAEFTIDCYYCLGEMRIFGESIFSCPILDRCLIFYKFAFWALVKWCFDSFKLSCFVFFNFNKKRCLPVLCFCCLLIGSWVPSWINPHAAFSNLTIVCDYSS